MALNANDRSIAGVTMTGHALVHWFETSIPIFLVVWLAEFDVSVSLLGLIVALGYAPFGLGALPGGILADRYGPHRLILVCLTGMSLAFVVLASAQSLPVIGLGLVCWGSAASIYHPAGLSLISTGVTDRGTVFAWHGIAGNVGIALGPFVAATLLLLGLDWRLVAVVLAVPAVIAVAYGLGADFDPVAAEDTTAATDSSASRSPGTLIADSKTLFGSAFALVFVLVMFEGLFYRGVLTYLPEILHGLAAVEAVAAGASLGLEGIEPADYIYVGLLVVGMGGQYASGRLIGRLPPERGLAGLFVILAVLAVVFVPVTSLGVVAIGLYCAVLGFALFAIQPFYQEAVATYTPADSRGLSYGYTYLAEFGLGSASIAIGGVVLETGLTAFFALLALVALTGAALSAGLVVGIDRLGWGGASTSDAEASARE